MDNKSIGKTGQYHASPRPVESHPERRPTFTSRGIIQASSAVRCGPKRSEAASASGEVGKAAPLREEGKSPRIRNATDPPGVKAMARMNVAAMKFSKVYPLYIQKVERKNRTKEELDQVIGWLTGYDQAGLQQQIDQDCDFETFFAQAPRMHPNRSMIKGVICGVRVEEIEDPLMRNVRYLDKLIDELAKGKKMEKILRK
jgi:hypothetical protein